MAALGAEFRRQVLKRLDFNYLWLQATAVWLVDAAQRSIQRIISARRLRRAVVTALVMAVVLPGSRSSWADDQAFLLRIFFHPWDASELDLHSSCTDSSNEFLYLSLGDLVFRWPAARPPMFEKLDRKFDSIADPLPPIPTDAYGCPGNPLPVGSLGLDVAADGTVLPSKEGAAAFVKLVRLLPTGLSRFHSAIHEESFQMICDGEHVITPQGMLRCNSGKPRDPEEKPELDGRILTYFKLMPDLYTDPSGDPMYVRCPDLRPPQCQVDYVVSDDIVVGYEFRPQQIDVSRLVEFDRSLRALIETARVRDFAWSDPD